MLRTECCAVPSLKQMLQKKAGVNNFFGGNRAWKYNWLTKRAYNVLHGRFVLIAFARSCRLYQLAVIIYVKGLGELIVQVNKYKARARQLKVSMLNEYSVVMIFLSSASRHS